MNENKYYIPNITDLRVGYECEWIKDHNKECSDDNRVKIVFGPKLLAAVLFSPMNWEREETDNLVPNLMSYKTPYLTKEQIEAEGWVIDDSGFLTKGKWYLDDNYEPNTRRISIQNEESDGSYVGNCPSINEFRTICKLLNI
jgi:hypothetical protein